MKEIWKDIKEYEGLYQVSSLNRIRSLDRYVIHPKSKGLRLIKGKILKQSKDRYGYPIVNLSKNCKVKMFRIHRLVAEAFIPNPDNLPLINHKNELKDDNSLENLEWCDYQYNNSYSRSKPVLQYTLDGEFVREWSSATEAEKYGFISYHIYACCNGKRKSHKGFIWRYK